MNPILNLPVRLRDYLQRRAHGKARAHCAERGVEQVLQELREESDQVTYNGSTRGVIAGIYARRHPTPLRQSIYEGCMLGFIDYDLSAGWEEQE